MNLPDGTDSIFDVTNGAVEGCGVFETGVLRSTRPGYTYKLDGRCDGLPKRWAQSAAANDAEVALVVLGAWDVLDRTTKAAWIVFGSEDYDRQFTASLTANLTPLINQGTRIALLEVACMRPFDAKGAATPPLPERGDDERVAHLNDLLRDVAADDPAHVSFIDGPDEWCADGGIATDPQYRWDGVHVYKPGAKLILERITSQLLAIPT
ncbi:MAG: hypothetical protein R2715_15315 [Ilumatobacteraceae bacterium]